MRLRPDFCRPSPRCKHTEGERYKQCTKRATVGFAPDGEPALYVGLYCREHAVWFLQEMRRAARKDRAAGASREEIRSWFRWDTVRIVVPEGCRPPAGSVLTAERWKQERAEVRS